MNGTTRAVIFDFDGVLVDSEPTHMAAILATVRAEGWDADERSVFEEFVGTSDRHCFLTLAQRHGQALSDERLAALNARKLGHFRAAVEDGTVQPLPGAFELLRAAAGQGPVMVCSGSLRATVLPVLEKFGVLGELRGVVCADDVARTKPDPEPYRRCVEHLGLDPGACTAIEDTHHGIAAAKGAGLRAFAVRHSCTDDRLAAADRVFDRIGQITVEALVG